jgi:hypothetical protein
MEILVTDHSDTGLKICLRGFYRRRVKFDQRSARIDLGQSFLGLCGAGSNHTKIGGRIMADLIIELLERDQIRSVYPLIREAVATIDLSTWLRFARQLAGPRRAGHCGIVTVRREGRTFPCGLFCYRVEEDLKLGKVLTADHFVAVDLLDPGAVLAALVEELDVLPSAWDARLCAVWSTAALRPSQVGCMLPGTVRRAPHRC